MADIRNILFVCTGNTCRSVMAEGFLRKRLDELGKHGRTVGSAGIAAVSDAPPTDETIQVMREAGIDVAGHRAIDLTDYLVDNADLIIAMEHVHLREVLRRMPGAASKTFLLKEYAHPDKILDPEMYGIQDPIGRGAEYYRHTAGVIRREIERIAAAL